MESKKRVVKYIHNENLISESGKNPAVPDRARIVHELIKSYDLLKHMEILEPQQCRLADLRNFHSSDYLEFLRKKSECDESDSDAEVETKSEFGLGFDCPTWNGIFSYVSCIAGATITACNELCRGQADIVVNWSGGWHHAHRDKAAGFCYINDVVLGILVLRKKFERVLYIDLDVHHGDGVEGAFETTKRVFTLSFHQHEVGFFPGTGNSDDCGFAGGKGYAANFPFKSGVTGEQFVKYFKRITGAVLNKYKPQACVVQCGGDVIAGDLHGALNLYPNDLIQCLNLVIETKIPLVILGGGGYNFANTSRYWTEITARICEQVLSDDIPDENEFFLDFGPDYILKVPQKRLPNLNSDEYLEKCARTIEDNILKYQVTCL